MMSFNRKERRVGAMIMSGLFVTGVMMCVFTSLLSPEVHHTFMHNSIVGGCDRIITLMSDVTFEYGSAMLMTFVALWVAVVVYMTWRLRRRLSWVLPSLPDEETGLLVRTLVDPLLIIFQRGIVRGQLYN